MDIIEGILTRHSTRKFKPDMVAKELLDTVIEAGRQAPTGGNMQQTHFIVIKKQDVLNELVTMVQEEYGKTPITEQTPGYLQNVIKLSKESKFIFNYHAPVLIVLCHKPIMVNNFADTAAAMQNMMLAANELDLGSCWVNQIRHLQDNERLIEYMRKLGMKDDEKVYASIALGYPDLPNGLNRRLAQIKGNPVTYVE